MSRSHSPPGSLPLIHASQLPDAYSAVKWRLAKEGGAVLHFAAVGVEPELIVLLSDRALYLYATNGTFVRCLEARHIEEVVRYQTVLGLRVPTEYDVRLTLHEDDCDRLLRALVAIYRRHTDRPLLVRPVDSEEQISRTLWLTPPANWAPRPELPFSYDSGDASKATVAEELLRKQREIDLLRQELRGGDGGAVSQKLDLLEHAVQEVASRVSAATPGGEPGLAGLKAFASHPRTPLPPSPGPHSAHSAAYAPQPSYAASPASLSGFPVGLPGGGGAQDDASVRVLASRLTRQVAAATQELANLKTSQQESETKAAAQKEDSTRADVIGRLAVLEGLLRDRQGGGGGGSGRGDVAHHLSKMEGYLEGRVHEATAAAAEAGAQGGGSHSKRDRTSLNVVVQSQRDGQRPQDPQAHHPHTPGGGGGDRSAAGTPPEGGRPQHMTSHTASHTHSEVRSSATAQQRDPRYRQPFWGGNGGGGGAAASANDPGSIPQLRSPQASSPYGRGSASAWGGGGGAATRARSPPTPPPRQPALRGMEAEILRRRSASPHQARRRSASPRGQRRSPASRSRSPVFDEWARSRFVPEVESEDYPSERRSSPRAGRRYRCVTNGQYHTMRGGPSLDAEKTGQIAPGEVVDVVAAFTDPDGLCWVKLSKGGWCLSGYEGDEEDCFMVPESPAQQPQHQFDALATSVANLEQMINRKMQQMHGGPEDDPRGGGALPGGAGYSPRERTEHELEIKRLQHQVLSLEEALEVKTTRIDREMAQQRDYIANQLKGLRPSVQAQSIQLMPQAGGGMQLGPVATPDQAVGVPDPRHQLSYSSTPYRSAAEYAEEAALKQERTVSPPRPQDGPVASLNEHLWGTPHRQERSMSPPNPDAALGVPPAPQAQAAPATPLNVTPGGRRVVVTPHTHAVYGGTPVGVVQEEGPGHWRITAVNSIVRADVSLGSRQVAVLPQAEVVEVAEVVGDRARVVAPVRGWVSVVGEAGSRLMVPSVATCTTPTRSSYAPQARARKPRSPARTRRRTPPLSAPTSIPSSATAMRTPSESVMERTVDRMSATERTDRTEERTDRSERTPTRRNRSSRSRQSLQSRNPSRTRSTSRNSRSTMSSRPPFR